MRSLVEYVWRWTGDILSFRVTYEDEDYRYYKAIVYGKKWVVTYCISEREVTFVGVQDDTYDYVNDPDGWDMLEDDDPDKTVYTRSEIIPDILKKAIEDDFRKRGELYDVA